MQRMKIKKVLVSTQFDVPITVAGWVRTRRDSKAGFSFIELNDGSSFDNLQVLVPQTLTNYMTEVRSLHPGASIRVTGTLQASAGSEQAIELHAETVTVLGLSQPMSYPLGKQRVTFERLRELPHLRPRTNTFGAVARIRHTLSYEIHRFFHQNDFLYVHTPIITASDCEGAGAMFQVTTLDPEALPRQLDGGVDYTQDFFGCRTALTVSGQLEGESYACALGAIYTFGPTFRAENSNTRRHLSEFWMVEPEMAFADLEDVAELAGDFLRHLFRAVVRECGDELRFFNDRIQPGIVSRLTALTEATFARITYTEAIRLLEAAHVSFEFPPSWGIDLQSEHERYLTEVVFKGPVIVSDYPAAIKAFYMRRNDDGKSVAAMDVLLPGVGEIIGGSQREERLEPLIETMRQSGLDPDAYTQYLDLRRFGSVPHAGFGLGFERLVQFCTGMHNIRDVIPYPRAPGLC